MTANNYKAIRLIMGDTQAQFAECAGVSRETIARRENGKLEISREAGDAARYHLLAVKGCRKLPSMMTAEEIATLKNA